MTWNYSNRLVCTVLLGTLFSLVAIAGAALAQDPERSRASEEILETEVGFVQEEEEIEVGGQRQFYQKLELIIIGGPRKGEVLVVEHGTLPEVNVRRYKTGDRVFVRAYTEPGSPTEYMIDIPSRWLPVVGVGVIFALSVAAIAQRRSITSLLGLGASFAVVLFHILPLLAAGADPMRTILTGSALIVPISFYLAHGISIKTTVAVVGTAIALFITVVLAQAFVGLTGLTGYASEEAGFLQALSATPIDIRNLLVAGIIVGALGVLDDVTISQAAIVQQLQQANPQLGLWELFRSAMQVGQDHIASVVNTLALVYAGAALPLLLLLRTSALPLTYLLSQEIIAEEIVRMLVASIGLMAAVPITTLLAAAAMAFAMNRATRKQQASPDA